MTGKKQALGELLKGFLIKFGDSEENKLIISAEIEKTFRSKEKISIKDLDALEEILLYKLNPSKKLVRRVSLSPIEAKSPTYPSPTLINIKPDPSANSTRSISNPIAINSSPYNTSGLNSKAKPRRDSLIFPSPNQPNPSELPDTQYSKTSNYYTSLSPGRKTLKFHHDHWGKIARAENIKYKQEQELSQKHGKLQKQEYWLQLSKQIQDINLSKQLQLKERDQEVKLIKQQVSEYESHQVQARLRKNRSKIQQKLEYEKAIQEKLNKAQANQASSETEKNNILVSVQTDGLTQKIKLDQKGKLLKEIEAENLTSAMKKQKIKHELKLQDSHKDLIHLIQNEKDLTENQKKFKSIINEKAEIAHNQDRLLKFYPVQKSLKDYQEEANLAEKMRILQVVQEEEEKKAREAKEKLRKTEEVAEVLAVQVKESEEKKQEFKNYLKEQGEIWKLEDFQENQSRIEKKIKYKARQKEIKETLDKQVKEKQDKEIENLMLSPVESKMNSKLFSTAIKILGED